MAVAVLGFAASPAHAVDIIEAQSETAAAGWQAGTCELDPTEACSPASPGMFFTQAAGHPPKGFTQIYVKHQGPFEEPTGNLKTVLVDLPPGLSVNPQATPQCELENGKFPAAGCLATTQVGVSAVTASVGLIPPISVPPVTVPGIPVYNLVPRPGEPARFGFTLPLGLGEVFLNAGVAWDKDYHEYFTIHVPSIAGVKILKNRLTFFGTTGQLGAGGAFLTTPSTCNNAGAEPFKREYTTYLHADSVEESAPEDSYDVTTPTRPSAGFVGGSQVLAAPLPQGVSPTGCASVPFEPTVGSSSGTAKTDSPEGPTVEAGFPFDPQAPIANSTLRTARVSLPLGTGLNPSAAPALKTCTDVQLGKGTTNAVACPAGSEVGTAAIETPVLPAGSLTGKVYLGQQLSRDPTSGNEYRVFIVAESARYGQSVRLVGHVSADPKTGRLTTTVSEAPQLPFTSVKVKFDGAKGTLTSPPTCGPNVTNGRMTPWSGTADANVADKGFTLTSAPAGGPCAKTMAARPFAPTFSASSQVTRARAFSPFSVHIDRSDGQQELKGVDITLPPGATAKLKGVPYCPPAKIAAAAASSAAAEKADPSCPASSLVGVAKIAAGSGPSPLKIDDGKAYLAGPYRGAPLSLAVITPAAAGPFDLGAVVVRVALFLDPETAQIHAVSDPIPDVFGGAKLDVRSIDVNVNKENFTLNGTNCRKAATTGTLAGGGSDPTNPASFSSFPVSSPFQGSGCKKLKFKPRLSLKLSGATQRGKDPQLRAVLRARPKDANIRTASVGLPHALFLDQASLATICTRVQFAANNCPKRSIYGHAKATTPLLGKPLKGPVYLRSSNNPLPDLVAHLKGQVDVDLVGKIDAFRGGIRTTFGRVPDVPVSKFTMTLPGGKHGLLVASRNLCEKPVEGVVRFKAQNGRKVHSQPKLSTPCGKKSPKKKGGHGK
jgi:hypothetical protein